MFTDIVLPADSADDVPMLADLYVADAQQPHSKQGRRAASPPLAILVPGFAGSKELYTMAAQSLVRAGYATMVVAQPRDQSSAPLAQYTIDMDTAALSAARPQIVQQAVQWAQQPSAAIAAQLPPFDASTVVLLGHSHGARVVVDAVRANSDVMATDEYEACPRAAVLQPLRPVPGVCAAVLYGYANTSPDDALRLGTDAPPVMILNGAGDTKLAAASGQAFASLPDVPRANAVLPHLDHFSVADQCWLNRPWAPQPESSELSQAEQVAWATNAAVLWFDTALAAQQAAGTEGTPAGAPSEELCQRWGRLLLQADSVSTAKLPGMLR